VARQQPVEAVNAAALLRAVAVLALTLTAGCAHVPDTTLRQDPPAVAFTALQRPFDGARLAVDPQTQAARWQRANSADWLDPITEQPQARWLNGFVDLDDVPTYLATSRKQRALPVLVAYAIPNRGCSNYREGLPYGDYDRATPRPDSYAAWIGELVNRLGPTHAVVVLEPDALPADCFDDERAATLKGAVDDLTSAGHHVYIDAGHSSWRPSGEIAQRLLRSGVDRAEGVSLNVSNRYPTWSVADFGEELSELIGGRDYIIDSSRNGSTVTGTDPASLSNDWCNRPDQALGVQELGTPDATRWPHLAAQLWIKLPGESDGNAAVFPQQDCHGEAALPGVFSAKQARELILNDPLQPAKVRSKVRAASLSG
jgi:endoglucanase